MSRDTTQDEELRRTVAQLHRTGISLRESEERFRQPADNVSGVFWIVSPDFERMHYVSVGYEAIGDVRSGAFMPIRTNGSSHPAGGL